MDQAARTVLYQGGATSSSFIGHKYALLWTYVLMLQGLILMYKHITMLITLCLHTLTCHAQFVRSERVFYACKQGVMDR